LDLSQRRDFDEDELSVQRTFWLLHNRLDDSSDCKSIYSFLYSHTNGKCSTKLWQSKIYRAFPPKVPCVQKWKPFLRKIAGFPEANRTTQIRFLHSR
jgi:hypothetical protein